MKKLNTIKQTFKSWLHQISLVAAVAVSMIFTSSAATYTIGTGTTTNTQRPLYTCYGYNYSQQIYTQAEINTAGASGAQTISAIRFYYATAAATPANYNNWTVYLGNTSQASFASTTNWIPIGALTQVYSGTITFPAAGNWVTLTLSTPFTWNGTGNLVVAVDENSPSYSCTAGWRVYTGVGNRQIGYYSDTTNPDPNAPPTANIAPSTTMPQMQFEMTPSLACSGTPNPGNTLSSVGSVCSGVNFTLSMQNSLTATGLSYQWQSALNSGFTSGLTNLGTGTTQVTSQTVARYYRCAVSCGANTGYSTPILVNLTTGPGCLTYCASNATSTADEEISNVTFGTLNNSSVCSTVAPGTGSMNSMYSNYRNSQGGGVAVPSVQQLQSVPFSVTMTTCGGTYTNYTGIWIDWNQNGSFTDAGENVYMSPSSSGTNTKTGTINIPLSALTGTTVMRVISQESSAPVACGTYSWGETEDYEISITAAPLCTGTTPGSISGSNSVCSGSSVSLTLNGASQGIGINYQWQSSPAGLNTWTNIGTNSTSYSGVVSSATDFRVQVSCQYAGVTQNSPVKSVTLNAFSDCYCASNATSTADEEILGVSIGGMTNNSTCGQVGGAGSISYQYSNYKGVTPGVIIQGASEPISLTLGYCNGSAYTGSAAVFIDWNKDGVFDATTERVWNSPYQNFGVSGSTVTGTFTVPTTAGLGTTGMRVVYVESNSSPSPCGTYTWGETEDYLITVQAPQPMTLVSITTEQQTGVIGAGSIGGVILINIKTNGTLNPLSVTYFGFTTSGTTDPSDILSARIYSTGTSNTFSTSNMYGSPVFNPSGTNQITASQTLTNGNNYFFLSYEIAPWLTACNDVVDGTVDYISLNNAPNAVAFNSPAGATPVAPPITVSNLAPVNGYVSSCRNVILSWSSVAPYTAYDVYVDGSLFAYNISTGSQNVAIAGTHTWEVVPTGSAPLGCTTRTFTAGTPLCYCVPTVTYGCGDNDIIARVTVNTLDNNSGTSCPSDPVPGNQGANNNGNGYSDYTSNSALTTTLMQGYTYPVTVYVGQWTESFAVWVDGNDDGEFTTSERVGYTTTAATGSGTPGVLGGSATFPITLDCNSPIGTHRMRVRCVYGTSGVNITPCGSAGYGETEDYLITYTLGPVTEAVAAVINGPTDAVCGSSLQFTATGYSGTLQWQYSLDYNTWSDIANATSATQGLVSNGPATYYLRVRSRGVGCTPDAYSDAIVVNIVSPTVEISQTIQSICRGTSTVLTASSNYQNAVYTWSNGMTGASITVSPLVETTYTVNVGSGLCTANASATISVSGPTATIGNSPSTAGCPGTQHTLTGNLIVGLPASGSYDVTSVPFSSVAGTGTTISLTDDQLSGAIALPFSFSFYGNTYNNIYISSNGFVTFDAGAGSGCCSGQVLPNTTTPNNVIALDWEDLNPPAGGSISYFSTGSSFVINYTNIQHFSYSAATVTGQIVLNSDGTIQINNISIVSDGDGTGDTQGIENSLGTLGTAVSGRNGSDFSSSGESFLFSPPSPVPFTFDGPVTYSWSNGGTGASINVSPDSTTTYVLTVSDNSCSSSTSMTVNVFTPPTVSVSNNGPICNGATVNLTANGSASYGSNYTFRLTDSYGDGWNGATMEVRQGSSVVATLGPGFTTGNTSNVSVSLTPGLTYSLVYTSGGSWPSEVGIQVINNSNVNLLTIGAGTGTIGSTLLTWTPTASISYAWSGGNSVTSANNTANPNANTTYSVVITDVNGCTATGSTNVSVVYPSITCPSNITVGSDFGLCGAIVDIGTATAGAQPCSVNVTNNHTSTEYPVGTTTVTWTATDAYGNTATCTQDIVVNDVESPIVTCPSTITACADAGVCNAIVNIGSPVVSDNCGIASVTNNHPSSEYPVGTTLVTWTVTDIHGNTSTCNHSIVVNDCENPQITAPVDFTTCSDAGVCEANVNIGSPITSDNCGVANVTNDHLSSTYPVGTTVVTWTVTDIHGNTNSVTQNVTINDCENPVITCPMDRTAGTDPNRCGADVNIGSPIVSDNCGVDNVTNDHQDSYYPVGQTDVTWTVTDIHGNQSTCVQHIIVNDIEYPVITDVHAGSTIDCPNAPVFSTPSVTDNCSATMTYQDVTTAGCGNTYTTTRTWTAIDPAGNTSTASETIVVRDITAPTITCNGPVYLCYEESNPTLPNPSTSDACNSVTVTRTGTNNYPVGTTTVTWTATDACGNASSCTQNVVRNSQINAGFQIQAVPGYCQGGNVIITIINVTGGTGNYTYLWSNGATSASVTVPNNATYTCTVTDNFSSTGSTFNCSRTFIYTANLNVTTLLSNYTIIGTNDVHIHGYQTILNGGVGATSNVATGSGCTGGRIKLHRNSTANSSTTFLKAKCIEVDATSSANNQYSGTPANPPMPVFDAGIVVPTTAPNVTVASNTVVTLSGTVYGNIMVKAGGKLTFLHATIDCKKLQIMDGATVRGDKSCTRIRMEGNLMVMKNAIINPPNDNHDFAIYVDNTNTSGSGASVGSGGSGSDANASVIIQQSAQVKSFIYTPNGTIEVHGPGGNGTTGSGSGSGVHSTAPATTMTGLFIGLNVNSHGRTIWNWNTNCMTCNYTLRDGETAANAEETLRSEDLSSGNIVENFPDPFVTKTNIRVVMTQDTRVNVEVYDLHGKLVRLLFSGNVRANEENRFELDGSDLSNGMYIYKVVTTENTYTGKMLLVRQ